MKYSIVINNFNNEKYIKECVDSCINQTLQPNEIIVVDDGSSDDSIKILSQYQNQKVKVIHQGNSGQLASIIKGIDESSAEIIFLLDGDDAYDNTHAEQMLKYWHELPGADIIFCRSKSINEKFQFLDKYDKEQLDLIGPVNNVNDVYEYGINPLLSYFLDYYYFGNRTSCITIKKSHFKSLRINNNLFLSHDIKHFADLIILLFSALYCGRKFYVPFDTVFYRKHQIQISHNIDSKNLFLWNINQKKIRHIIKQNFKFYSESFCYLKDELNLIKQISDDHKRIYINLIKSKEMSDNFYSYQSDYDSLKNKIYSMENSLCWRMTAPFRWIHSIFQK